MNKGSADTTVIKYEVRAKGDTTVRDTMRVFIQFTVDVKKWGMNL